MEVLQEFIQEQSAGLDSVKKKTAGIEKAQKDIGALDTKVKGVADLASKIYDDVKKVAATTTANTERIGRIEEELKKRRVIITGQLRFRPEFTGSHRYFNKLITEDTNLGASHRARIGVDVKPADFISGRFTLQDARTWGSPTLFLQRENMGISQDVRGNPLDQPTDKDSDSAMRIHEACLDLSLADGLFRARVGRQEWDFGAGRLIGNRDWSQKGRSFDGLDFAVTYKEVIKADLLFSWIDERNSIKGNDLLFGGVYATSPYFKEMPIDAYFLYLLDDREGGKRKVATIGGRASGRFPFHKAFFFDLEGALQFGTVTEQHDDDQTTKDNPHYAVMAHIDAGYELPVPLSPALGLFFDLVSGDGNTSPTESSNSESVGWVPLFPSMHGQFGRLDLFKQKNIWDIGIMLRLEPLQGLTVGAEVHSLHMYDGRGAIPQGGNSSSSYLDELSTSLGTEVSFEASYAIHESLGLMVGYGALFPGATFSDLDARDMIVLTDVDGTYEYPRGDPAQWFYLQADLTF